MSDTFKYKILNFDQEAKMLTVEIDDSHRVNISLAAPYPTTMDEIDKIVRGWSVPKEVLEAKAAALTDKTDFSYIQEAVNSVREAERFSFYKARGFHKLDELAEQRKQKEGELELVPGPTTPQSHFEQRILSLEVDWADIKRQVRKETKKAVETAVKQALLAIEQEKAAK